MTLPPVLPPILTDVMKIEYGKAMALYTHPREELQRCDKVRLSLCKKQFSSAVIGHNMSREGNDQTSKIVSVLDNLFDDNIVDFKNFLLQIPGGRKNTKNKAKSDSKKARSAPGTGVLGHNQLMVELPTGFR